jgi:hypothetical protein
MIAHLEINFAALAVCYAALVEYLQKDHRDVLKVLPAEDDYICHFLNVH